MKYIIGIYLFFLSTVLYGQRLIFNSISLNNNLPSKECYAVFQDKRGYVWITTELGLCRLNANSIKMYHKKNGLQENSIYAYANYGGKFWLVTSKNRLLHLANDQLSESSWSASYQKIAKHFSGHTYQLYASKNLTFSHNGTTVTLDTVLKTFKAPKTDEKTISVDCSDGISLHYGKLPNVIDGIFNLEIIEENTPKLRIKTRLKSLFPHRFLAVKNNVDVFIALGKTLIKVTKNNSYETYKLPADIINLYVDNDNDLWIGTYKNGVYYCHKGEIKNPIQNLSSLSVSGILQDSERNIWCTTLEKGAFISKSKEIIDYSNLLGNFYGQAVIKTVAGETLFLRNNRLYRITGDIIRHVERTTSTNQFVHTYLQQPSFFNTTQVYDYVQVGSQFFTISYGNICKINASQLESTNLKSPGRCITQLNSDTILYGCDDGIYQHNIQTGIHQKLCSVPDRPTKIFITHQKDILIATKGSGVFAFGKNGLSPMKLPAETIYDITEDDTGTLWLASNKGLLGKDSSGKIITLTSLNGLPCNEVYKLTINDGKLYIVTSEGLISMPLTAKIQNLKAPSLYLTAVELGKHQIDFRQGMKLKYHQNSIQFKFDVLSYKNDGAKIKYTISPLDTAYRYAVNQQVDLDNLPPNTYQLQVQSVNSDGYASKPFILNFEIAKPFWQTWWFITLSALLALSLVLTSARYIFLSLRRKELEKAQINQLIAESKLTALQAQMNPHFIFNCINSIQNYILKKQEKDAYNYLSKFSHLIRMVLTQSQQKSISLSDELTMLDLYISLEQLRFNNSFEYVKIIDEGILTQSMMIPAMLIQPYVENAIWHGLMHLGEEKRGKLVIEVKVQDDSLVINIKDNGIGRALASEYRKNSLHQSFGMNSNQQRIHVLNQTYGSEKQFSVSITDLPNHQGTEVTIYIPIK